MDENKMEWREYARYAEMSAEELARDCEVQVFRATGPGGQGVNTTDSAVRMKHGPTGIVVTAREAVVSFRIARAACVSCAQSLSVVAVRRAVASRPKCPSDRASAGSTTSTSMRLKRLTVASRAGRNDLLNKLR